MKNSIYLAVRRSIVSPRFLASAVILVVSAVALQPGVKAFAEKYEKKPVAIRKPLNQFDICKMPSFRTGWDIIPLTAQAEDIGTSEYTLLILKRKIPNVVPKRLQFFVTYYSNPRDKVPHSPDVCSRQEGAIIKKLSTITLDVPGLRDRYPDIKCRLLIMDKGAVSTAGIYVFFVEDKFRYLREQVRWDIGMPGNSHTYFVKIDMSAEFPLGGDPADSIEACKTLFVESLPVLLSEYFPTHAQITAP